MLNLPLKTRQNNYIVNTRERPTTAKTCTLATASADGCRACFAHTASCKRSSILPSTSGFQLVENGWNNLHQVVF